MLYRLFFRPFLYLLPAETAHHLAFFALRMAMALPPLRWVARRLFTVHARGLETSALGLRFPSPVGLAAGFDKDARGFEALGTMGFGFVEVGTLTGEPQPGNPKPRLFRLKRDRALLNRMGFNNGGAAAAEPRLRKRGKTLVGVNIGKTKVVPEEKAHEDYVKSTCLLAPHADYLVVNVSSPNTPGLRDLQAVEKLEPLLRAVREAADTSCEVGRVPLLVKIAPDLSDEDVDAVADMALRLGLHGIIATNTTISRAGLTTPAAEVETLGAGGISGAPVRDRALAVLRRLYAKVGDNMVLIGVGGIATPEDAYARIRAGATLVQVYSGLIYEGPGLPKRLAEGMLRLARRDGFAAVSDAVGADRREREALRPEPSARAMATAPVTGGL